MFPDSSKTHVVSVAKSARFLLFSVKGDQKLPVRFELINLDGRKVRSCELIFGKEFVVQVANLPAGEYLYALRNQNGLLQTGVVRV